MQETEETAVQPLGREDPWRRKWQPSPVSLPGGAHGQRSLVGYSPWGHKELDTTEGLHFQFSPNTGPCRKLNGHDWGSGRWPPLSPLGGLTALRRLTESPLCLSPQRQPVQGRLGRAGEEWHAADGPLLRARRPLPPVSVCESTRPPDRP